MIAEAIDTALTVGYALAGRVIFLATVAAILALAAIACGAWGVLALRRRCAPVSRPQTPPGESSAATAPPSPAQRPYSAPPALLGAHPTTRPPGRRMTCSRYDSDPEALAWAHARKLLAAVDAPAVVAQPGKETDRG